MSKFNDDIFINRYPTLDLHGETRDTMVYPLKSFIDDNIKMGNKNIVIVHGIGYGILKETTHSILKKDKRVESFYQGMRNPGCTIVKLIVDK